MVDCEMHISMLQVWPLRFAIVFAILVIVDPLKTRMIAGWVILWGRHGNIADAVAARLEHPAWPVCHVRGRRHAGRCLPIVYQPRRHCRRGNTGKISRPRR